MISFNFDVRIHIGSKYTIPLRLKSLHVIIVAIIIIITIKSLYASRHGLLIIAKSIFMRTYYYVVYNMTCLEWF